MDQINLDLDNKEFVIYKWDFNLKENQQLINEALKNSEEIAPKLNRTLAKDTSIQRSGFQVEIDTLAGEIANLAWFKTLEQYAKENNYAFKPSININEDSNQIDIFNSIKNESIEVRSSFVNRNKIELKEIVNTFSSIGWYANSYKGLEKIKDYHLQAIYPFPNKEFSSRINKGFILYLTGGGSRKLFKESPHSKNQYWGKGSLYRIIKPLSFAYDAKKCCEIITGDDIGLRI